MSISDSVGQAWAELGLAPDELQAAQQTGYVVQDWCGRQPRYRLRYRLNGRLRSRNLGRSPQRIAALEQAVADRQQQRQAQRRSSELLLELSAEALAAYRRCRAMLEHHGYYFHGRSPRRRRPAPEATLFASVKGGHAMTALDAADTDDGSDDDDHDHVDHVDLDHVDLDHVDDVQGSADADTAGADTAGAAEHDPEVSQRPDDDNADCSATADSLQDFQLVNAAGSECVDDSRRQLDTTGSESSKPTSIERGTVRAMSLCQDDAGVVPPNELVVEREHPVFARIEELQANALAQRDPLPAILGCVLSDMSAMLLLMAQSNAREFKRSPDMRATMVKSRALVDDQRNLTKEHAKLAQLYTRLAEKPLQGKDD